MMSFVKGAGHAPEYLSDKPSLKVQGGVLTLWLRNVTSCLSSPNKKSTIISLKAMS